MKKIILYVSLLLIIGCTQTKQQKAENTVKQYLKIHLNDPHSYESVSFDTLKPRYFSYDRYDPAGKKMDTLAATFVDSASKYKSLADGDALNSYTFELNTKKRNRYHLLADIFKKKEDSVENVIKINSKGFKGPIDDYMISHTYRAKNGFGALGLHSNDFVLDSTLTKIINASNE